MLQKKKILIIIIVVVILAAVIGGLFLFRKSGRQVVGVSDEAGKVFNFTKAAACTTDTECALVHKGIVCPFCDRPECQKVDLLNDIYVPVNFKTFADWRAANCPSRDECIAKYGPLPDCPIKLENKEKVAVKCISNTCQKVLLGEQK